MIKYKLYIKGKFICTLPRERVSGTLNALRHYDAEVREEKYDVQHYE
jgi:hypothetical protein